jgi:hypothetical protein
MANMSYCRFRNTLGDFEDCLDALDSGKAMSDEEQRAAFWLIKKARELAEQFEGYSDEEIKNELKSRDEDEDY